MATTMQGADDVVLLKRLHGMFSRRVQDRRMEILGLFEDHAATHWAGPGHVTVNQFARAIDLLGFRLNRQEMTALCSVYCDTELKNEFNYVNFCAVVDPIFGRDGRCKGASEEYIKFMADARGGDKPYQRIPGNPYFDAYGQVKQINNEPAKSPLSARSPRKDAMMLRQGFQPLGSQIVNGSDSPRKAAIVQEVLARPMTPITDKPDLKDMDVADRAFVLAHGPGGDIAQTTTTGPVAFVFDHGKMIGVQAEGVDDDLARIQAQIFRRRIRTKEFFHTWDARKTGRITREQFSRGIANIIYPNTFYDPETPIDIDAVTEHFRDFTPGVEEPRVISYTKFCHAMDGVFNKHGLEGRPGTSVPKPGAGVVDAGGFTPRVVSDESGLKALLRRIAYLVSVHGIDLNTCFNDCQRSDADVRTGRIVADSFIRHFPLAKSMPTQPAFLKRPDMELLIQRYTDDNGWVRLFAFQADIEALQQKKKCVAKYSKPTISKTEDHNSVSAIVGKLGL